MCMRKLVFIFSSNIVQEIHTTHRDVYMKVHENLQIGHTHTHTHIYIGELDQDHMLKTNFGIIKYIFL
jgi:hypothetical protein